MLYDDNYDFWKLIGPRIDNEYLISFVLLKFTLSKFDIRVEFIVREQWKTQRTKENSIFHAFFVFMLMFKKKVKKVFNLMKVDFIFVISSMSMHKTLIARKKKNSHFSG